MSTPRFKVPCLSIRRHSSAVELKRAQAGELKYDLENTDFPTDSKDDTDLEWFLCNSFGRQFLQRFLTKDASGENLDFLKSTYHFKQVSNSKRVPSATQIYEKYIAEDGAHPIASIPRVHELIREKLAINIAPDNMFTPIIQHILVEMGRECFDRFLDSQQYSRYMEETKPGKDFKPTLQHFLDSGTACAHLQKYLVKEFTSDYLAFWKEACAYRTISEDPELLEHARKIFGEYVKVGSPREVCVGDAIRQDIATQLQVPLARDTLFDQCEEITFMEMREDSFKRFLGSSEYQEYLVEKGKRKSSICPEGADVEEASG